MVSNVFRVLTGLSVAAILWGTTASAESQRFSGQIYRGAHLDATQSQGRLAVGMKAPDFSLPSIKGERVSLGQFLGSQNVVISFVPAAFTPVCSEQWPGYNMVKEVFERNHTVLLGISTDNVPTLFAWTEQMGTVWFPVLSDFWPHGKVAELYGVLREDGTSERAIFVIDRKGIIRYMDVHDINERPDLEILVMELEKLR